jgi:two-component system chemotaxis sensor kinase CheA
MRIEDEELRKLYEAEGQEHLQIMETGLLQLESRPDDARALDEVFRAAHSLKGASKMLDLSESERIAHRFEDILGACRRGKDTLNSEKVDQLYRAVDALRRLVLEAVTGEPSDVDVDELLRSLPGDDASSSMDEKSLASLEAEAISSPFMPEDVEQPTHDDAFLPEDAAEEPPASGDAPVPAPADDDIPDVPRPGDTGETWNALMADRYRIETIRVETSRLDNLMALAGEMAISHLRITALSEQLDVMTGFLEEWKKERTSGRISLDSSVGYSAVAPQEALTQQRDREERRLEEFGRMLGVLRERAFSDLDRLETISTNLEEGIAEIRLLPLSTLFQLFPRMTRDLARERGKNVRLVIEGGETRVDKRVLEEMKDPLMHILRNAVDHGVESPERREKAGKPPVATIRISARRTAARVVIEVSDDGGGLDAEAIRKTALKLRIRRGDEIAAMSLSEIHSLIFASGFSTSSRITDVSGRGVGLDVVKTNIERLHGTLQVESEPGRGCRMILALPVALATAQVVLVREASGIYAIPLEAILTIRKFSAEEFFLIEGRSSVSFEGEPLTVVKLSDLLELNGLTANGRRDEKMTCIVLSNGDERLGILIDALVDEREVVLKPLGGVLKRVRNVSGATILSTGEICIALNPTDMMKAAKRKRANDTVWVPLEPEDEAALQRKLLLVEDSITTRTQEKRILESAGYEVVIAVDGMDALRKLSSQTVHGIVSDVEMPNLDGIGLAEAVRSDPRLRDLPIVLVTSLSSDEDRKRGLDAGANAYIAKPSFDQSLLLDTLQRLV